MEDGFKFSHNKRFKRVSFEEFLATAQTLCQSVSERCKTVYVEVMTAEDHETYNYTTTTFWSEEIEEALKRRKRYILDELTQEVWDRSFDIEVTLRDKQDKKPFMVCLSCDKHADGKRLRFYGQCLDEDTRRAVVSKFCHATLSYGIGDGMRRISIFNMVMGSRLTGIRLPI